MHVEDIEQIKVAKALYARHCDSGYDPDGVAGVFVEDGIWESEDLGLHEGREAIRSFMSGVGKSFVWARHLLLNPIIEVDEARESARAQWLLWCPAVIAKEDGAESSVLMVCNYDDRLVKRDGRWWFQHMRVSSLRSTVLPDAWRDGLAG
jgi:hypothetical protein